MPTPTPEKRWESFATMLSMPPKADESPEVSAPTETNSFSISPAIGITFLAASQGGGDHLERCEDLVRRLVAGLRLTTGHEVPLREWLGAFLAVAIDVGETRDYLSGAVVLPLLVDAMTLEHGVVLDRSERPELLGAQSQVVAPDGL